MTVGKRIISNTSTKLKRNITVTATLKQAFTARGRHVRNCNWQQAQILAQNLSMAH